MTMKKPRCKMHGPKTLKQFVRTREAKSRLEVFRQRLDRGGYTSYGRYYGIGAPLFSVYDEKSGDHFMVRASDANDAREKVLTEPNKWRSRH
jgi:hypothetical protein